MKGKHISPYGLNVLISTLSFGVSFSYFATSWKWYCLKFCVGKRSILGVANGKCETLRDRETSVFLWEPETFWLFGLRDRDFKVLWVQGRDVHLTLKIQAPDLVESYENELEYMQKSSKEAFCCKQLCQTLDLKICQQSINSIIFLAMT